MKTWNIVLLWIVAGISLCASTAALLLSLNHQTSFEGPDWENFTHVYDGHRFVINNCPKSAEFGSDATGIAQGVVGAVEIPQSVTAPNHSTGVAGYARTASSKHIAVGVHGFGGVTGDGGQACQRSVKTSQ
jgi:hypothetical protein